MGCSTVNLYCFFYVISPVLIGLDVNTSGFLLIISSKFINRPVKSGTVSSVYQPTNAHIISHKTRLKHFKTPLHVSILSDHHQGALSLAKVILRYSQFNSYLQTRCCGSISCCVGMCCGAVARCASYDAHKMLIIFQLGTFLYSVSSKNTQPSRL